MKQSLFVVFMFVLGCLLGDILQLQWQLHEMSILILYLLMFSLKKELEIAKVICKPPVLVPKTAQKSSLSKIEETTRM